MGNVANAENTSSQQDNTTNVSLDIDLMHPVNPNLKQLLNWSLPDIRQIYSAFRRRKNSPFLNRTEFSRLVGLSRTSSFYMYPFLTQKDPHLTVFEVICILVMSSYSNIGNKIHYYYLQIKCSPVSHIRPEQQKLPEVVRNAADVPVNSQRILQTYSPALSQSPDSRKIFQDTLHKIRSQRGPRTLNIIVRLYQTTNQLLNLQNYSRIVDLFQNNLSVTKLLTRFEPELRIKEEYSLFNRFIPYTESEAGELLIQILKQKYPEQQSNLTKPNNPLMTSSFINLPRIIQSQEKMKRTIGGESNNSTSQNFFHGASLFKKSSTGRLSNFSQHQLENSKSLVETSPFKKFTTQNPTTLEELRQRDLQESCVGARKQFPKCHSSNVLIIKGSSVTKKEIFKLKDYFDSLSNGGPYIGMQEFLEAFSSDKFDHMRSVTASLFNFLDRKQNGKVSFSDLLFKVYPSLSNKQHDIIRNWISQYQKMYDSEKKRNTEKKDEIKKRTLPKSCMIRVREIFNLFDRDKKGWLSLADLQAAFSKVFTEKELLEMFNQRDTDQDGKLQVQDFVGILLPPDIQIEGCKSK